MAQMDKIKMENYLKKYVYGIIALLIIAATVFGMSEYRRPAADRSKEGSVVFISASQIHASFANGDSMQIAQWMNDVVQVTGVVQSLQANAVILVPGVVCALETPMASASWKKSEEVTIKGRVLGFDDLFNEVQLDFCVEVVDTLGVH